MAAAAVAGLALLGPRMLNDAEVRAQKSPHCREHRRCSVGEPSTFTRFVGRSGVSSVIAARPR